MSAAWVIDLGYGHWMARCENEVCNPTNLAAAKRQALAMAKDADGAYRIGDSVGHLNGLAARLFDAEAPRLSEMEDIAQPSIPRAWG